MVFKRKDRPGEGYRIWPTLPQPWGRVGPWQTGLQRKNQAQDVERWIQEMARTRPELIDLLVAGRFRLMDAWVAKLRGTLDELVGGVNDPLLTSIAASALDRSADPRIRSGLQQLIEYAPAGMRLSQLRGKEIVAIYRRALESGRKPNTVKRSLHRAVAELLREQLGTRKRNDAFVDVTVPSADDTREVRISREEMKRLLDALHPDFFDMPVLAMLLAVDRGPLLRITPRLFDEERGLLGVLDTKTQHRPRTIELSTPALYILQRRCAGRGIDEPVFPWSDGQVRNFWETARDAAAGRPTRHTRRARGRSGQLPAVSDPAGERALELLAEQHIVTLPVLRFKDLRHLLPTAWNALGLPAEDLKPIMGWSRGSNMSERYTTARVEGDRKSLDAVAAYLGLDRIHLRAVGE